MVALIIGVLAFGAGFALTVLLAPPLAATPVGVVAGFVVAGLIGAAMGVLAVEVFTTIDILSNTNGNETQIVSAAVSSTLADAGTLAGLAAAVYLLAPGPSA